MSFESGLSKFGRVLDKVQKKTLIVLGEWFFERGSKSTKSGQHAPNTHYSILFFDSFIAFLSLFVSIHLRIGMDFLDYSPIYVIKNMLVFGLVGSSVFLWFQTHQSFWRYTSIEDIIPIFLSVVISNIIFFPLMMLMNQEDFLPYSVLIINIFVLNFMLLIPRFTARILYNNKMNQIKRIEALTRGSEKQVEIPQILLVGGPASVDAFLREIFSTEDMQINFDPVGVLSIDQEDVGRSIKGVPIVGTIRQINFVMKEFSKEGVFPKQLFVTEKNIPENLKNFLVPYVQSHGILLMHVMHQYTFNTVTE